MMRRKNLVLIFWLGCVLSVWGCVTADKVVDNRKAEAKKDLGLSYVGQGNLQIGLKELVEAAALDPDNAEIQNGLGFTYQSLREYDKAVIHYRKAIKIKRDYAAAQNNLGTVYIMSGEWDLALEVLTKAAEDETYVNRHRAYNNIGRVYYDKRQYRQAIAYYQKAIDLRPRFSPAYDNMGFAYERMEEWDRAIQAYRRSIEFSPGFPLSYLHLGRLFLRLNRHEEATAELLMAIEKDDRGQFKGEAQKLLEQIPTPQ
jgi:type IV pilus biogenesis/stability protein PilW